ncbi:Endonuclease III [compost metagenome]
MPRFLKPEAREAVLKALEEHHGGIGTALEYRNAFELLIAVLLSAQTTDVAVNKVTRPLFDRYPTPADIAPLDPEVVREYIKTIGFANTKAKNVVATCRLLMERHGGEVPRTMDDLVALPGVGRKTANVVLSVAFGEPTIPVDTHVFRVSNRLGLADSDDVEATEQDLMKTLPVDKRVDSHHWLIWHGRKICKAPTPKCEQCFLTAWCHYYNGLGRWKGKGFGKTPKAPKAPAKPKKA